MLGGADKSRKGGHDLQQLRQFRALGHLPISLRLLAQTPVAEGMNGDAVRRAWACRVLEQPEDPALSPLLDELAAPGDSTEAQLIQRTERVLYTWFRRARRAADDRQWREFRRR